MERRTFLVTTAAVVVQGLIGFEGRAAVSVKGAPSGEVGEALARARAAGKPLLVLVVPTNRAAGWQRGRAFGAWINTGGDDAMRLFALCEVVAATQAKLAEVVPAAGTAEALLVLVETDRDPAQVRVERGTLPEIADVRGSRVRDPQRDDDEIQQQVDALTTKLHALLVPDAATLARRVAQAKSVLPPDAEQAIQSRLAHGELPAADADRAAALLFGHGPRATEALAAAAEARVRRTRIPGSHWAKSSGCGETVEDPPPGYEQAMVACGMGHVPARAARFLDFYVEARQDEDPFQ
jgi:hypothetical protein